MFAVLFATNLLLYFRKSIQDKIFSEIKSYKERSLKRIEEINEFLNIDDKNNSGKHKKIHLELNGILEKYDTRFNSFIEKAKIDTSKFLIDLQHYVSFLAVYYLMMLISTSFIESGISNGYISIVIILSLSFIVSILLFVFNCNRNFLIFLSIILFLIPYALFYFPNYDFFVLIESIVIKYDKEVAFFSVYVLLLFFIVVGKKYFYFILSEKEKYIVEAEDKIKVDDLYTLVSDINNIDKYKERMLRRLNGYGNKE